MFYRLNPGYTDNNLNGKFLSWNKICNINNISGFWENTFGLFGLYKSDWIAIGGWDKEKFNYKWGREDNDVLDK